MSEAPQALSHPSRLPSALTVLFGALLSILLGMNLAMPSTGGAVLIAIVAYVSLAVFVARQPFVGFMIFAGSLFMLVVFAPDPNRYINALDAFIPVVVPAALFGAARRMAVAEDARLDGPEHTELRRATRRFAIAGILYAVICIASLIQVAVRFGAKDTIEVSLALARCLEGAVMLPLGLWLLRSEKRIDQTVNAIYVAGALFTVVNLIQIFSSGAFRAGMTWVVNHPDWPVEAANEAGASMVMLWALILAQHQLKPRFRTYPMLGIVLFLVFLTQSRSGLLALITFTLLSIRRFRWQYVLAGAVLVPIALKLVPPDYISRITKSVTFEKGTFEVYSILIRVYGYQSSWRVFVDHWLFGVGYLSCRYVSHLYNDLNIIALGAENFYLETAAGLGVIGLGVVAYAYVRLFQLGAVVKRVARPGTWGSALGRAHVPLMVALSVANLTGDNFVGLIGMGQLMLWIVLLIRAGHVAIPDPAPAGAHDS